MKMIVWFGFVLCALSAAGKDFITEVGKKVNLECGVNVVTNWLFWYKGSEMVRHVKYMSNIPARGEGNIEIAKRSRIKLANLEISDVKETDAGEFRCEADGKTSKHTLAVVSVSVVPSGELEVGGEATLKCLVKALDQSSKVEWRKPDGSVISKETVQLKPLVVSDGGTWQCHVTYKEVAYQKSLTITVKASAPETTTPSKFPDPKKNNNARPDKSDHASSDTGKLFGFEWWVWAALGAGCLVLILLVIFIIIMCKRVKRKKRKFLTMKRAQQLQIPKKYCECERQTAAAKPQQGRRREKPSPLAHQPLLTQ
ncbi:uncharacterized protein LOC121641222 isoform X2 [Melanotaenia boesemani]|uniref:uncharacterized protein LOC121641222 isoform X2 n=1 Tax=Melanotaenia boesemani TaxID=1250792 RepID=UPI001C05164F|nr:uncharacterized protein LOC121641222 isoform X2 [Melanotaenia boesemani]